MEKYRIKKIDFKSNEKCEYKQAWMITITVYTFGFSHFLKVRTQKKRTVFGLWSKLIIFLMKKKGSPFPPEIRLHIKGDVLLLLDIWPKKNIFLQFLKPILVLCVGLF